MKIRSLLEQDLNKRFVLEIQQELADLDFDVKVIDPRGFMFSPPPGHKHHHIKYTVSLEPSHNFPGILNVGIQTGDFGWSYGSPATAKEVIVRIQMAIRQELDDDLHSARPEVNS